MKTRIEFIGKHNFKIKSGEHEIVTDLPEKMGGNDTGPTPVELFIGALGSCAGFFAVGYLQTAGLNPEGLSVDLDWDFDEKKTRVGRISATITVPNATLGAREKALVAAAEKCIIHSTIQNPPEIKFSVKER